VDVEVHPGEVVAVLGPNGAGKSSLLRLLGHEYRPTRGTIVVDGKPLEKLGHEERARRVAVLPQVASLELGFAVHEVVMLGRMPHYRTSTHPRDAVIAHDCLEMVGLGDF